MKRLLFALALALAAAAPAHAGGCALAIGSTAVVAAPTTAVFTPVVAPVAVLHCGAVVPVQRAVIVRPSRFGRRVFVSVR